MENRPRSREKNVSNSSKGVYRRGDGLNTGPVGKRQGSSNRDSGGGPKSPFMILITIIALLFGGGGSLLSGAFSDSPSSYTTQTIPVSSEPVSIQTTTEEVDTTISSGARNKFTTIKGNKKDQTTLMIYMCGTDLESRSGMATNDLKEIANATSSDQIDIIVYTGGCAKWQLNGISTKTNQIYQIKDGKLLRLESNMGSKPMTEPDTLTEFIQYGKKNFPANRYDLILWDHGGGSITGYGYDQNYSKNGSMSLSKLDQALTKGGIKFDFIGFDACLMATAENAMMLSEHADYMIASEEVEPGIGWYYTNWLSQYAKNPSMDTLSIGKNIIDSYIEECSRRTSQQGTTLSIVDLAEFNNVVPSKLKTWSKSTTEMIRNSKGDQISQARHNTREFNHSKIDQCDFVDLLNKLDTKESKQLSDALLKSIKYNRTSRNMSNAYGLSIYFPNKNPSNVKKAAQINSEIGMDNEFSSCLKEYASLQLAGQEVAQQNGNTGNPYSIFFPTSTPQTSNNDQTSQILQDLFSVGMNYLLSGRDLDRATYIEETAEFIADNQFDASQLKWQEKDGKKIISLSEDQWKLVTELEMNMFYDDGSGYIDLGYDNQFEFDKKGNLIGDEDATWLHINDQPIAYYHASTVDFGDDNYCITGYVPAILNGTRVDLVLVFDQDNPYGVVVGSITNYQKKETNAVAKVDREIKKGDVIEFVCDYYDYNGNYKNSYYLGDPIKVTSSGLSITDAKLGKNAIVSYRFTDIYSQEYWTPILK